MPRAARFWTPAPTQEYLPARQEASVRLVRPALFVQELARQPTQRTCPAPPHEDEHVEMLAALRDCMFDVGQPFSLRMSRLFALHAGVRHASIESNGLAPCPTCGAWGPHTADSPSKERAPDGQKATRNKRKIKKSQPVWACTACGCRWREL